MVSDKDLNMIEQTVLFYKSILIKEFDDYDKYEDSYMKFSIESLLEKIKRNRKRNID